MRVYLAGPMTGLPDYNYPAFHAKAAELRARGYTVANPAEHFGGDQTLEYSTYLAKAVATVIDCDAICMLPGWHTSKGARLERVIADMLQLPVIDPDPLDALFVVSTTVTVAPGTSIQ